MKLKTSLKRGVKMASKKDYEKIFNELLGVNVKWSLLPKEDLAQLAVVFSNPEVLLKKLGYNEEIKNEAVKQKFMEAFRNFVENYDGPLIKTLRQIIIKKGGGKK